MKGKAEGLVEGKAIGKEEAQYENEQEKRAMAHQMLADRMSIEKLTKYKGLAKEEVEKL